MKRQVDIREISDGKLYGEGDMVKADTGGLRRLQRLLPGNGKFRDPGSLRYMAAGGGPEPYL